MKIAAKRYIDSILVSILFSMNEIGNSEDFYGFIQFVIEMWLRLIVIQCQLKV